jgi:hypothetical protein
MSIDSFSICCQNIVELLKCLFCVNNETMKAVEWRRERELGYLEHINTEVYGVHNVRTS